MPSYSVNLNAVVAQAATAVTRLQAVCAYGGSDTQVCVANAANLALAGGKLRGIALENQAGGFPIQIIDYGSVNATMVGTGPYVNYDASGNLALSTTSSTNTVGTYENGVIHVNLDFAGTGGNATSIGGVSVPSASGGISQILAGDGTNLRGRQGVYNFRDFLVGGVGPDETGTIPVDAWLRLALATVPNGATLQIPQPASYFLLDWDYAHADGGSGPITYFDDAAGGYKNGITIIGEGPGSSIAARYHFRVKGKIRRGTAASVTARTNGGSGDFHQTWTLDPAQGITVATKARWIGRHFCRYGCATDGNNGTDGVIVDVPADNVIRVSNRNDTAAGTDANNGAISWWIDEPLISLAAKDTKLQDLSFGLIGGADIWAFVELTSSARAGARSTTSMKVVGCNFSSDAASSGYYQHCIAVARDTVGAYSGATYYRGQNGLGENQYYNTEQTSECFIWGNTFQSVTEIGATSAVAMWSVAAQSKNNIVGFCRAVRQQFGVCVPRDVRVGGVWAPLGQAHFNLYDLEAQQIFDAIAQAGDSASDTVRIHNAYSENTARLFKGLNTGVTPLDVRGCDLIGTTSTEHGSGAIIDTNARRLVVADSYFDFGNNNIFHITHRGIQTNREAPVVLRNVTLRGTNNFTCEFGVTSTALRGPYDFGAGGQKRGFKVDGGAQVDVTFSQANFNAVLGYTVNLRRVRAREVAAMIENYVAGSAAWGDGDDAAVYVRSATNTAAGSIQSLAPASGTDANTVLSFAAGVQTNRAQTRLCKDSSGFVDWTTSAGTSGKVRLVVDTCVVINSSTSAQATVPNVNKCINSATVGGDYGGNALESVMGISQTAGAPTKNLYQQVTITGAATTGTWTFARSEEDTSYDVIVSLVSATATAAAGSLIPQSLTKATGSVVLTLRAAPGGTDSVVYHLELRR